MTQLASDPSFYAVALQTACRSVDEMVADDARASMHDAIRRINLQISSTKRFIGADLRLVVLPEYVLTGFPWRSSPEEWRAKAAISEDGSVFDGLAAMAAENDVFLCANIYETDPNFPALYFQSNRIFDRSGAVILNYRRLISMFAPSPYDVLDRYLDIYGADALFPVADTEIGRLGTIASEEILYPEIARSTVLKGAEVLLHPTSEMGARIATPKDICKPARAVENMAYLISANTAGVTESGIPDASTDGLSKIVDYKGGIVAEAGAGETISASGEIDISALRRYRQRPGMSNLLSRQPMRLYRDSYSAALGSSPNGLGDGKVEMERSFFPNRQAAVLKTLTEAGVLKAN